MELVAGLAAVAAGVVDSAGGCDCAGDLEAQPNRHGGSSSIAAAAYPDVGSYACYCRKMKSA
eukprot:4793038-Pleurochrysis_carterae.AAC.7